MRGSRPALFIAVLFLATPAVLGVEEQGEALLPGQVRERTIAGGEKHIYTVQIADIPLLITVEQKGINLVVEAQGPAARLASDARYVLFGSEVLLLEDAGEHRLEIHPKELSASPGDYTIQVEALETSPDDRRAALALMSRAGQEAFEKTPEARHRALATFREALTAWSALGDRRWEAESLDAIAGLEAEDRELRLVIDHYSQALALWRELGEPRREASTLQGIGLARAYSGELAAAREALRSSVALWQHLGERFEEGMTRSDLCYVEQISGDLRAALTCYEEPLALFRDLGDQVNEARILNNLGGVYYELGEPDAALEHDERALALRRALADRRGEAETLNNIAVIDRALGDWQEALRVYDEVRQILAPLGDRWQEAALLNNVGVVYNNLGEPQRALTFLTDALKLRREIGDGLGEINVRNNLGDSWRKLGDPQKGLDSYRNALERAIALGDARQQALTRIRLGEVQLERSDPTAALREIEPALEYLKKVGFRQREAQTLQLRGRALVLAGRPNEALSVFQEALTLRRALRDRAGEAAALQSLAAVERSLGLHDAARGHAEEAVARVEELRTGFASPDLRAAFLATQRRAYSLVIDLLMDRHAAESGKSHDRAAFEISERARARSLLDVLGSRTAIHAGSAVPAALLERRQSLRRRLSAKADQQVKQGGAKADAVTRDIEMLLTELDGVEAEIRRLDPRYAAVSAPRSLGVEDVGGLLEPDTLLLEYSLGEERSYLWAIGSGFFRSFVLPPQREIEGLARQLYEELSTREAGSGRRQDAAAALSRILLGPVWPEVARYRRLVVVPDAALHLLPFGALTAPASGGLLVEHFEIAYLPSATTLALQRQRLEHRPPAAKWAAVLADPVFVADDQRLAGPTNTGMQVAALSRSERGALESAPLADLTRLPASRHEAEKIAALAPGKVWAALDLAASREAVFSGELRDYRFVHFATHGLADTRTPELSGLVLSLVDAAGRPQEGFLSLSDIYELDLSADLVVLSGCRTALGKEVRGEGIMGLSRGFLYAGVPRVVASLWPVQDRSTAELMSRFYRALWQGHLPPAAALREAQRSLRHDPRYRDPYSWAGFVLQGDWR
jgi:CHAT domain-containing protein/tetratricopeptide (TPR) repeat protein